MSVSPIPFFGPASAGQEDWSLQKLFAARPTGGQSDGVFRSGTESEASSFDPAAAGLYAVARATLQSVSLLSVSAAVRTSSSASRGFMPSPASGAVAPGPRSAMGRFEQAADALGLDARSTKQLKLVAKLLERLDPEAFERLVSALEGLARSVSSAQAAPATAASPAAAPQFQLEVLTLRISVTEVSASASSGAEGETAQVAARRVEIRLESVQLSFRQQAPAQADPLVLDLNGDGVQPRPLSDGVRFDITGSGQAARTAFVQHDDALLFYDANRNGSLDSGSELVGNRSPGGGAAQDLAALDENHDGEITSADAAYDRLYLYRDLNGDGSVTPSEAAPLRALGIEEISALLARDAAPQRDGAERVARSTFRRADGTQGTMWDFLFSYLPA